ncbi:hypothetical protein GM661_14305 [Iocasia frigidifontis]|uniref:Uncharacterized protein n=1 Tax=Iocasia fonsfrigidae TaxID=2682810 RepID=A0A8A7KH17_9FIRM|nr:hypothetical protein [Iocasia fonsfrigidae]QTL99048.1 hypothetical protein GM661_14305 [Iocasia fonsfrigidae]
MYRRKGSPGQKDMFLYNRYSAVLIINEVEKFKVVIFTIKKLLSNYSKVDYVFSNIVYDLKKK